MFTVIEVAPQFHHRPRWLQLDYGYHDAGAWVVWCGWQDAFSAAWPTLDEACRDAALKESTYQLATGQAIAGDQRSR